MPFRIYVHNGYDFEWTPHIVEASSVAAARKEWARIGSPSETRKFRVSREV